jgi:hypothetical protein
MKAALIAGAAFLAIVSICILAKGKGTAPAAKLAQSTPAQLAAASKCEAALKHAHIYTYKWADGRATVEVGDTFYRASFDDKSALTAMVRCAATEGRLDDSLSSVEYLDWHTHQQVGRWNPYSGLKIGHD